MKKKWSSTTYSISFENSSLPCAFYRHWLAESWLGWNILSRLHTSRRMLLVGFCWLPLAAFWGFDLALYLLIYSFDSVDDLTVLEYWLKATTFVLQQHSLVGFPFSFLWKSTYENTLIREKALSWSGYIRGWSWTCIQMKFGSHTTFFRP